LREHLLGFLEHKNKKVEESERIRAHFIGKNGSKSVSREMHFFGFF
jgi:hypothetical protein